MSTELELIHTDETPVYHRLAGEPIEAYEAFVEWCKVPYSSRNLGNFLRRTAYPQKLIRKLMDEWRWEARANAFDNDSLQLRPDPTSMDEEVALAGQMSAAATLLDLGLRAIEVKNPALISADKALKLVEKGVEIQRRALGQADLNIQFTVDDMTRVNRLWGEVMGEEWGDDEIEEATIIPVDDLLPDEVPEHQLLDDE